MEINYFDMPAPVSDYIRTLKLKGDRADACALYPEHVSEEFLGQAHVAAARTIAKNREPAAQPGLDRVEMVAEGGLGQLPDQDVSVAERGIVKNAAIGEKLANDADIRDIPFGRGLHQSLVRHHVLPEEQRGADHPLDAGETDLDRGAVMRFREQRDHPVIGEVAFFKGISGEGREVAAREGNGFKMRPYEFEFVRRQNG